MSLAVSFFRSATDENSDRPLFDQVPPCLQAWLIMHAEIVRAWLSRIDDAPPLLGLAFLDSESYVPPTPVDHYIEIGILLRVAPQTVRKGT